MCAALYSPERACILEPLESRQYLTAPIPNLPYNAETLTKKDVSNILAAAASEALPTQIITVVDRDGQILGILAMSQAKTSSIPIDNLGNKDPLISTLNKSVGRARTVAFFESYQDAFTMRTARFIIQDHFPQGLPNTPGGPLYGVQFSDLPGSDVVSSLPLSGDPGGIPLFKDGVPVGGIGVAGDGSDRLARADLPYDPNTLPDPRKPVTASVNLYDGTEENDVDEQVALAGAAKFSAPKGIIATGIFVGGLRFPFTIDNAAAENTQQTLSEILDSGDGSLVFATKKVAGLALTSAPYSGQTSANPRSSPGTPFPAATIGGITGLLEESDHQQQRHLSALPKRDPRGHGRRSRCRSADEKRRDEDHQSGSRRSAYAARRHSSADWPAGSGACFGRRSRRNAAGHV